MMRLIPSTALRVRKLVSPGSVLLSSESSPSSLRRTKRGCDRVIRFSSSSSFSTDTTASDNNNSNNGRRSGIKSLALSTWFHHPDFDMEGYEILCRASAFLLSVDPRVWVDPSDPYAHLKRAEEDRKIRDFKIKHKYTPAHGGKKDRIMDMGWLEFVPREHRPNVHVMCSSHVASPFLWQDYYPQDWLSRVRQEHCKYYVEVFDHDSPEPIGQYALHNSPFHHPEGRDLCVLHLKDEETVLDEMKKQGVECLYLRDVQENMYKKDEEVIFDGFEVALEQEEDTTNQEKKGFEIADAAEDPEQQQQPGKGDGDNKEEEEEEEEEEDDVEEDARVFMHYREKGSLAFTTKDNRYYATTPKPLPEGMCGGPVLDANNEVSGIVEGIVPLTHENKQIAGSACFLPSYVVKTFIDYAERGMVELMMPKELFSQIVTAKRTNSVGGGAFKVSKEEGKGMEGMSWSDAFDMQMENLKKTHSKEEMDALLANLKREREEVKKIMDDQNIPEELDLDEVIAHVRANTLATRDRVMEAYKAGNLKQLHPGDDKE